MAAQFPLRCRLIQVIRYQIRIEVTHAHIAHRYHPEGEAVAARGVATSVANMQASTDSRIVTSR